MKDERRTDHPCPTCGGRSFSWGRLQARFVLDEASTWERYICGVRPLRARRCDECGNVQVFTEPDPSRTGKRARKPAEDDLS